MTPPELEEALIQLAIAEVALLRGALEKTGIWIGLESLRRVRAAIRRYIETLDGKNGSTRE